MLPPLSPEDHATLLAIISPDPDGTSESAPDPVSQADFLARPDIQPHLEALAQLRALRAEIKHEHRMDQAAELLLETARKTDDLVEKRRAADALVRLLLGPSTRRTRSDTRSDSRAHRKPAARPSSNPNAPSPGARTQPTNPPPVPLPASFLALLHPDDPLRQQHAPLAQPPESHTTPHALKRATTETGGWAFQPAAPNEPPSHPLETSTPAAGAPQSHNTS